MFQVDGSAFVYEYRKLPRNKQARLRVVDESLADLFDIVMRVVQVICASDDRQTAMEQIAECLARVDGTVLDNASVALAELAKDDKTMRAVKRAITQHDSYSFLLRAFGNSDGASLAAALRQDVAFLAVFTARLTRGLMPIVAAWEDTLCVLSNSDRAALARKVSLPIDCLQVLIDFENAFTGVMTERLPKEMIEAATEQITILDADNIIPDEEHVHLYLIHDGENRVALIDPALVKKLKGAATALKLSEDGVSQAANSLIELIDRILRGTASDESVLNWLGENQLQRGETTYSKNGMERPTKFGQCLYFLYGGGHVLDCTKQDDGTVVFASIYFYLAKSLVAARNDLQEIKHTDNGTADERSRINRDANAIIGVVEFASRFGWVYRGPENRSSDQTASAPLLGS